ncbi:MAG: cytochrome c1 [Alphaproteobacteria bacterium]
MIKRPSLISALFLAFLITTPAARGYAQEPQRVENNPNQEQPTQNYTEKLKNILIEAQTPQERERKRLGIQYVLFLIIFSFILWRIKRRIWKDEP